MMRVDFYSPIKQPLLFAKKLVQTVYQKGSRLFILLENQSALRELEIGLWCLADNVFLPHCNIQAKEAKQTPILLGTTIPSSCEFLPDILLNLTDNSHPQEYLSGFKRILEIVKEDDIAQKITEERLMFYQAQSFEIFQHNIATHQTQ